MTIVNEAPPPPPPKPDLEQFPPDVRWMVGAYEW